MVSMLEKAPADDLEEFFEKKKYQIEAIYYTVTGFNLMDLNREIYTTGFEKPSQDKLAKFFENNKILSCFE